MTSVAFLDARCLGDARDSSALVWWYLAASYAYYVLDRPLLSDAAFDRLCRKLGDSPHALRDHPHRSLVDPDWFPAGTCLLSADRYPEEIREAVIREVRDLYGEESEYEEDDRDLWMPGRYFSEVDVLNLHGHGHRGFRGVSCDPANLRRLFDAMGEDRRALSMVEIEGILEEGER